MIVLLAIMLPSLFGMTALVLDGGLIFSEYRNLQHATDAAATAAAVDVRLGNDQATAIQTARDIIGDGHLLDDVDVTLNRPPTQGGFAGNPNYVEVVTVRRYESILMNILDGVTDRDIQTRAVAGVDSIHPGAAIVILDPRPSSISLPSTNQLIQSINQGAIVDAAVDQCGVSSLLSALPTILPNQSSLIAPGLISSITDEMTQCIDLVADDLSTTLLPPLPALIAGLEIEGLGKVIVNGSVHVNNEWGGVDECHEPAGSLGLMPQAVACMPLLSTTRLQASHIRVVGGVDHPDHYLPLHPGDLPPLRANRIPVPDPFIDLPGPPASGDPADDSLGHCVKVVVSTDAATDAVDSAISGLLPILKPLVQSITAPLEQCMTEAVIQPGVYDSLTVVAPLGGVRFEPGVYTIRGKNPVTGLSLAVVGPVEAQGVMFYIGDPSEPDPSGPPAHVVTDLIPSVVIAPLIPGGAYTGLSGSGGPLDGMLIYQNRNDRRPIIMEAQHLLGDTSLSGKIYAKWGHLSFVGGMGSYDLQVVTGTARFVTVGNSVFDPVELMPKAEDVYLVE